MKTLFIVRHGKSSWDSPGLEDRQRPLLETGRKRTHLVGGFLFNKGVHPDLILSSYATRAFETAKIMAEVLNYSEEKIEVTDRIYHNNADGLFQIVFGLDNNLKSVMLVGHNPTLTDMANHFLDDGLENLCTSGVVCVEFHTDNWEELFSTDYKVKFVITPKKLRLNE